MPIINPVECCGNHTSDEGHEALQTDRVPSVDEVPSAWSATVFARLCESCREFSSHSALLCPACRRRKLHRQARGDVAMGYCSGCRSGLTVAIECQAERMALNSEKLRASVAVY
jgi:hypothetical protein